MRSRREGPHRRGRGPAALPLGVVALLLLAGCGQGDGWNAVDVPLPSSDISVTFHVTNAAGMPVVGARIYLVDAADVDGSPITPAQIRAGTSEDRDEPLEDAVRLWGGSYLQAVTDGAGMASITGTAPDRLFWFVEPTDGEHLPGGSGCRLGRDAFTLDDQTFEIEVSSSQAPGTGYVGTSTCLGCHPGYASYKKHAHRLTFMVPGQPTALQDTSEHPDIAGGWARFLPAATYTGGTAVYLYDYDPSRGYDKFQASLTDPSPGETVYVRAWLWRDTGDGNKLKITLVNVHPMAGIPAMGDPPNVWTLEVPLTYGGALSKQRHLVKVPGRNGLYPLLQWQVTGDDSRYDQRRRVYRDYHLDWFWNDATKTFKLPPLGTNFDGSCTACHATGFERWFDNTTGEWRTRAVSTPSGVYDIDGDGNKDELNLGCEVCHGPGQQHFQWAANPQNFLMSARYIVTPQDLSPSREMMICGRCHGRELGNWDVIDEEPLDPARTMLPPGGSRADYLASYVTRKGPAASDFWSGEEYSQSNHQQYTDLLRSSKYRNGRLLVTCSGCHGNHGDAPYPHELLADPGNLLTGLCQQCHIQNAGIHMLEETGSTHAGPATACTYCHAAATAMSGAGVQGNAIWPPTGTAADADSVYFQNDIHDHRYLGVARKVNPNVLNQQPINAMPIPYTRSCGAPCHVVGTLPSKGSWTSGGDSLHDLLAPPDPEPDDYGPGEVR